MGYETQINQDLAQALALFLFLLNLERVVKLGLRDDALADEKRPEFAFLALHSVHPLAVGTRSRPLGGMPLRIPIGSRWGGIVRSAGSRQAARICPLVVRPAGFSRLGVKQAASRAGGMGSVVGLYRRRRDLQDRNPRPSIQRPKAVSCGPLRPCHGADTGWGEKRRGKGQTDWPLPSAFPLLRSPLHCPLLLHAPSVGVLSSFGLRHRAF